LRPLTALGVIENGVPLNAVAAAPSVYSVAEVTVSLFCRPEVLISVPAKDKVLP
jgi:hypothetical protein